MTKKTKKSKTPISRPWKSDKPLALDDDALGAITDSLEAGDIEIFESLSASEKTYVLNMVESLYSGDTAMLEALYAIDYERIPVEPDIFFTSSDYFGHVGSDVFKKWWGHLLKCADPTNGIYEVILTGAIGLGKTFVAMLLLAYKLYRLSCMKDPAKYFGLAKKSKITFGVYSLTLAQAEDVGFYVFKDQFVDESPYFREVFPRKPHGTDHISWPQKSLQVIIGSSALHAIGKDLFGIAIDEVNFMEKGKATAQKAHELANAVSRRLESRFMTGMGMRDIPGLCIFISSKRAETDYLEQRIKKVRGLPGVHVVDGPQWEFFDGDKIDYCGKKFRVLLGDATHDPEVLDRVEFTDSGVRQVVSNKSQYEEARLEGKIIEVPVEHFKAFQEDVTGAIRDVAGIATAATINFFPRKKVINDMFHSGESLPRYFNAETIVMPIRSPVSLTELFDIELACAVHMSRRTPYRHPTAPRYIHVDLARNKDAVGFVMLHPSEFSITHGDEVQGIEEEGVEKSLEVDIAIRLVTDDSGEDVDFAKIENFIIWLSNNGFWIRRATFDSWQSANSIQTLKTFGLEAGVRSVDKTVIPYRILKSVMNSRRISAPMNTVLKRELGELIYKTKEDKVDHPEGGSKDIADGLAATAYECVLDKLTPSDTPTEPLRSLSSKFDQYLSDVDTPA